MATTYAGYIVDVFVVSSNPTSGLVLTKNFDLKFGIAETPILRTCQNWDMLTNPTLTLTTTASFIYPLLLQQASKPIPSGSGLINYANVSDLALTSLVEHLTITLTMTVPITLGR